MGVTSLRSLTALLILGSAAVTFGMRDLNEASAIANGLVLASETSGQSTHASLDENVDLDLTEKEKRCVCYCTSEVSPITRHHRLALREQKSRAKLFCQFDFCDYRIFTDINASIAIYVYTVPFPFPQTLREIELQIFISYIRHSLFLGIPGVQMSHLSLLILTRDSSFQRAY